MSQSFEIDRNRYFRQMYVIVFFFLNYMKTFKNFFLYKRLVVGKDGMVELQKNSILISEMNGLGVEIAKNIILSGIKSVTIQDETIVSYEDLANQVIK
jgi:molybdopterin/thiamine biosynthesis adenylyltransferase